MNYNCMADNEILSRMIVTNPSKKIEYVYWRLKLKKIIGICVLFVYLTRLLRRIILCEVYKSIVRHLIEVLQFIVC